MADGGDGGGYRPPCDRYILVNREPVPEPDLHKWGQWMGIRENRIVGQYKAGRYFVSTVFLGLDHNFGNAKQPILFETMIFYKDPRSQAPYDSEEFMSRYHSWYDAERAHKSLCRQVNQIRSHILPRISLE